MNVMQLNTDIYNSLGVLSNDESYLGKAARYLKKLVVPELFPLWQS